MATSSELVKASGDATKESQDQFARHEKLLKSPPSRTHAVEEGFLKIVTQVRVQDPQIVYEATLTRFLPDEDPCKYRSKGKSETVRTRAKPPSDITVLPEGFQDKSVHYLVYKFLVEEGSYKLDISHEESWTQFRVCRKGECPEPKPGMDRSSAPLPSDPTNDPVASSNDCRVSIADVDVERLHQALEADEAFEPDFNRVRSSSKTSPPKASSPRASPAEAIENSGAPLRGTD